MELTIVYLALADALNPCALTLLALLLLLTLRRRGKGAALLAGTLFVGTVYTMYTLYGLGILTLLELGNLLDLSKRVVSFLALLLGLVELAAFVRYRPGLTSLEMPTSLRPLAQRLLFSVTHPLAAIPVAVLCSVLLLPCSSGPYLVALPLMGSLSDLLLYNLIFVSPMLLLLLVLWLGVDPDRMLLWKEQHVKELHLFSGLLLLAVGLYLLVPLEVPNGNGNVLAVLDPGCPHCRNLVKYLERYGVTYKPITREEALKVLERLGKAEAWDGGVPLLIYDGIIIEGFPAGFQDEDGVFKNEEELCRSVGGRPVYVNGSYVFCVLPNGFLLGNAKVVELIASGEIKRFIKG